MSNVVAVGCQDTSDKECTKKKIHEALLTILDKTDIEKFVNDAKNDLIFARISLIYHQTGKPKFLASSIRFYEDENTPLRLNLYGKIPQLDFTIEKPTRKNTSPALKEIVYFKINRSKKTLEPLYNHVPSVLPFSKPDSYVIFPGCEEMTTRQDQMRCFEKKMILHLSKYFNRDRLIDLGLKEKFNIKINFSVAKNGSIKNLRITTPNPQLVKSIEHALKLVPNLKPSIVDGMPKNTPVRIPFNFIVE
ncbi:hypothetical protein [Kordia sp.]|uniref:hypothetical protein n=1 Tax=Kordia sp. TaxID=1965332 RepID=UPI003D6C50E6